MWENETVVLITSLKKRLLEGKEKIRFGKISSDTGIPGFIKSLFQNQVQFFLEKETPLSIRSTQHFDFQENDLENLKNRLLNVFREAASFTDQEVEKILQDALILRLNYLIKPVDTMRRLLFENKESISHEEVDELLISFKPVLPYAKRFLEECEKQQMPSLTSKEYGKLITDVVHHIMDDDPVKIVLSDFSVLKDYLSETKGEEINRIEGAVVQEFLVDRNQWGFRRALDVEMKLGKMDFASSDLEVTLKRYLELKEEFSKNSINNQEKSVVEAEKIEEELSIENSHEETLIEVDMTTEEEIKEPIAAPKEQVNELIAKPKEESLIQEGELDFGEVFDDDDLISEEMKIEESTQSEEEKPKASHPMRIIRRDQQEQAEDRDSGGSIEEQQPAPDDLATQNVPGDFRTYIDEKTDKSFVKKLFNGDRDSYEQLLKKLDDAESWRVAKILIDNELFKRDIDPFSREAIKLVDLVYSRYYPEEGVGGT